MWHPTAEATETEAVSHTKTIQTNQKTNYKLLGFLFFPNHPTKPCHSGTPPLSSKTGIYPFFMSFLRRQESFCANFQQDSGSISHQMTRTSGMTKARHPFTSSPLKGRIEEGLESFK
jgi:hypothetical protein